MATKLYPIGMQTFSEIREEDFLYVDKTEYIYRMTHTSGKYFFLRADNFCLSHREPFITPKEIIIRHLEKIYGRRIKNEAYIIPADNIHNN